MKKGSVSSLVPMVAAAARTAITAPSLNTKSNIPNPFLYPPGFLGVAISGAFPLATALDSGTSMLVESLLILVLNVVFVERMCLGWWFLYEKMVKGWE